MDKSKLITFMGNGDFLQAKAQFCNLLEIYELEYQDTDKENSFGCMGIAKIYITSKSTKNRVLVDNEFEHIDIYICNDKKSLSMGTEESAYIVVESDTNFLDYLNIEFTKILLTEKIIKATILNQEFMPLRGKNGKIIENALKRTDIPMLLDTFINKNKTDEIFVVQGGNRFISKYLSSQYPKKIYNLKLLCVSKVKFSIILNTIITQRERYSGINHSQAFKISKLIDKLDSSKKAQILKRFKLQSSKILNPEILKDCSLKILIDIFGNFILKTPFSYPFDDSKIEAEFTTMMNIIEKNQINIPNSEILNIILEETIFAKKLLNSKKSVFIDDLFYRGRTLYTIVSIAKVFNYPANKIKLYTLCADRVSKSFGNRHIKTLDKKSIYPFENSIRTERGYWYNQGEYFVFLDLEVYWEYLDRVCDKSISMAVYEIWQDMIAHFHSLLEEIELSTETKFALIAYFVFHKAHNIEIDQDALADQRGSNIGYCVFFARIVDKFINQEEPAPLRWEYKNKVKKLASRIIELLGSNSQYFQPLVTLYQKNHREIDYERLKFIFDTYDYGY
jgi:hypothetical protein